jgi:hypothetical protein
LATSTSSHAGRPLGADTEEVLGEKYVPRRVE